MRRERNKIRAKSEGMKSRVESVKMGGGPMNSKARGEILDFNDGVKRTRLWNESY